MQHRPGELHVFGTSGDWVIFSLWGVKAHVLRSELPDRDYNPGDIVPGDLRQDKDGTYHPDDKG